MHGKKKTKIFFKHQSLNLACSQREHSKNNLAQIVGQGHWKSEQ